MPCDNEGKDWPHAVAKQGMLKIISNQQNLKEAWKDSSLLQRNQTDASILTLDC